MMMLMLKVLIVLCKGQIAVHRDNKVVLYCTTLYEAESIILKFLKFTDQMLGAIQYKTERKRR